MVCMPLMGTNAVQLASLLTFLPLSYKTTSYVQDVPFELQVPEERKQDRDRDCFSPAVCVTQPYPEDACLASPERFIHHILMRGGVPISCMQRRDALYSSFLQEGYTLFAPLELHSLNLSLTPEAKFIFLFFTKTTILPFFPLKVSIFFHLPCKHLFAIYYVPGTVLDIEGVRVNKVGNEILEEGGR